MRRPGCLRRRVGFLGYERTARRLPFGRASFDAAIAVEVFEHLAPEVARSRLRRGSAGAQAGGDVRRHRQERVLVECPSSLAAEPGGEVDRRAPRPLDVLAPRSGARALVPAAGAQAAAAPMVSRGAMSGICFRVMKQGRFPFQWVPAARLLVLWAAKAPGGPL